jgi:hypothetical protein
VDELARRRVEGEDGSHAAVDPGAPDEVRAGVVVESHQPASFSARCDDLALSGAQVPAVQRAIEERTDEEVLAAADRDALGVEPVR